MTTLADQRRKHRTAAEATKAESERATIALTARVARELGKLKEMTGLSKTDLFNRAISLYFLTQKELDKGNELAFYDPETGEYQRVHIA
ncbi:hypothetical protein GCM10023339_04740 [Alloalcanivorax gelatiniphagus]